MVMLMDTDSRQFRKVRTVEVNVDVQVNRKVKTTEDGSFLSGQVYFSSTISMSVSDQKGVSTYPISAEVFGNLLEEKKLTDATRVNLSRAGTNPNCNMRIDSLDAHDHHAPTFSFQGDMEDYINRVMTRVNFVVDVIDNEAPNWTPGEVLPGNGYLKSLEEGGE